MKELPSRVKGFSLNLSYNNLGENSESLKCLGEGIKQLSDNI